MNIDKYIKEGKIKLNKKTTEKIKEVVYCINLLEIERRENDFPLFQYIETRGYFFNKLWKIIHKEYPELEKYNLRFINSETLEISKKEEENKCIN